MAYQDQFYTVGTVTVTGGSTAVTGAGTGWETALIVGGVFYAGGGAYPIQSVSSETELTLAIPYVGADAAGIGYAIDRQRAAAISNIAMNDRLAQIIREISIGNIEELNALDLIANRVLATDTAGHLSLEALGTLGRALLALAAGNNTHYVQGDGTLQTKAGLPVSTATQTALNGKLNLTGGSLTGPLNLNSDIFMNGLVTNAGGETGRMFQLGKSGANSAAAYFDIRYGVGTYFVIRVIGWDGGTTNWFTFNQDGGLAVPGALTAGSKSFKIDHVKDPYNKYLVYMSTEAPKAGIEDWGRVRLVNGQAEVDLDLAAGLMPGTFAALTQRAIVVSINNLDSHALVRAGRISDGKFTILADDPACEDEVTWHVKAERADPFIKSHPYCDPLTGLLIAEHEKED
ncbi:hypothetical protein [Brucella tritici]|uniref:hypothetical protein n=1 Tax=Brucella tritici TaxID=94626 RepID=UPI003D6CB4E4